MNYADLIYYAAVAAYAISVLSCIVVVLSERRNPIKSLAWVIALIFLPVAGLVFYLFFGRSMRSVRLISRRNKRKLLSRQRAPEMGETLRSMPTDTQKLVSLAGQLTGNPLASATSVEIFTSGREKFKALERDILHARHSINLQYYIFSDDSTGHHIADLLMQKAREGVKVRVIYDHVGSFSVRTRFFTRMRKAGVEAHPFFRVTFPQFANRINFRNHRKLVIIDDRIGYIGGMNIADRYVNGEGRGRTWRDTHVRVEGEIVAAMLYQFSVDWNFLKEDQHILPLNPPERVEESVSIPAQLITSGPTDHWASIALLYQKAILSAHKSVYIQTPYFLPTDALLKALQTAALAHVDVRIMIPERSDSSLLRAASFSYINECLQAGIKVYLYKPGMLHAKTMTVDDELVSVGSTNFDFRSFEHNFEGNLLFYDKEVSRRFRDIFFADIKESTKLTLALWRRRRRSLRMAESIARLVSPIL
ncbi:MAG: cardiolipin synthase [Bacteroidales bacterium]|nr:cardiolipin synthase [Bacteroidales bacterium]